MSVFFLTAAVFTLCKTLFAVNWPVSTGLKRNFTLFLATRANCLEHFSWPSTESTTTATTLLKSHIVSFLVAGILCCINTSLTRVSILNNFCNQFNIFLEFSPQGALRRSKTNLSLLERCRGGGIESHKRLLYPTDSLS